jgi:hypothetical protein
MRRRERATLPCAQPAVQLRERGSVLLAPARAVPARAVLSMLYTYGHVAQQKRRPDPASHASTSSKLAHVGQNTDVLMQRQGKRRFRKAGRAQ